MYIDIDKYVMYVSLEIKGWMKAMKCCEVCWYGKSINYRFSSAFTLSSRNKKNVKIITEYIKYFDQYTKKSSHVLNILKQGCSSLKNKNHKVKLSYAIYK